jgi:hypothetical protein
MTTGQVAALILEWWRAGEQTSERLDVLMDHFYAQYRLRDKEALVREIANRKGVTRG